MEGGMEDGREGGEHVSNEPGREGRREGGKEGGKEGILPCTACLSDFPPIPITHPCAPLSLSPSLPPPSPQAKYDKSCPSMFQSAEYVSEHGQIDYIVDPAKEVRREKRWKGWVMSDRA